MRKGLVALALGATIVAAACSRAPEQRQTPKANPDGAVTAYLDRFSAGDPAACFDQADLDTAALTQRSAVPAPPAPTRVIVAVDASGSMAGRVSGRAKLALAKAAASAFVDDLPPDADAGLLVFGQAGDNSSSGKDASCRAVSLALPPSRDRAALAQAVSAIRPVGWTPLAAALQRAEALLAESGRPGEQVIYVVSDGQETCGGDPVAVARTINAGRTRAVVNIIGFDVADNEAAALAAVASAGGGRFVNSRTDREFDAVTARIREDNRRARNAIATANATARNAISTDNATARARICTSNIVARERIAVSNDIARKRIAGQDVATEERAEGVMAARHAALENRVTAYVRRLEADRDRLNGRVEAEAARAR